MKGYLTPQLSGTKELTAKVTDITQVMFDEKGKPVNRTVLTLGKIAKVIVTPEIYADLAEIAGEPIESRLRGMEIDIYADGKNLRVSTPEDEDEPEDPPNDPPKDGDPKDPPNDPNENPDLEAIKGAVGA